MITYQKQTASDYIDKIRDGLQRYNRPYTGEVRTDSFNVYVFDKDRLIGSAITEMGWNWVYFVSFCFIDDKVGRIVFDTLYQHYHGDVVGIKHVTSSDTVRDHLVSFGFTSPGKLSHTPEDETRHVLINTTLRSIPIEHSYRIESSEDPIEEYQSMVDAFIRQFEHTHNMDGPKMDIIYTVQEESNFLGGIYGILDGGILYVRLLFVDRHYRFQGVGAKLMSLAEEDAKQHGAQTSYVSTVSFQALGFYEKQGYTKDITIHDKPKSFNEYILSKTL